MFSIKLKFNKFIVDLFFSYPINFGVSRRYSFFTGYTKCHALPSTVSKYLRVLFQYKLESVQNKSVAYIFHYIWSSLEIMCIVFIVLLLENSKLFHILLLFCLYIEILDVSSLFKYLIASTKCSESWVETLQIFFYIRRVLDWKNTKTVCLKHM